MKKNHNRVAVTMAEAADELPTKDSVVVWLLLPLSVFWALALAQFEPSHFERSKVVIHDKPSNEMAVGYRLQ